MTGMKRAVGLTSDGCHFGDHDHICWAFEDRSDFVTRAIEFLADGLRRGLRVAYVAPASPAALERELAPLGDVPGLLTDRRLLIASLLQMYPSGSVIDPDHQVEEYRRAARTAVADGFRGFRVAAEATPLAQSPAQHDAFTRYEHRVDRMMAAEPFSAMCGYDAAVLGAEGIAGLACLHPAEGGHRSPFHLFARDGERLALAGELDLASDELFRWALDRAGRRPPAAIDLGDVAFIDHRALIALERWAQQSEDDIALERATPTVGKVVAALGLARLRVEAAT